MRDLLEEELGRLWVVGEISNLRRASSGHVYFTLKDDEGQLRAVLFRSSAARLPFDPEEGLEVLAYGEITLYAPRGDLQILVRQLEPRGVGALQLAFEQLRARLEAEGLFEAARKRALPERPRRVGIVTSATGAAIRDVIHVSGRRFPSVPLLLAPSRVQGVGAEEEIAAALERLQAVPDVDVILLVRGGGSLEDLQPFNTERIARALRASRLPVVSGVGHEVDVTIADLAADARAATPSAAAALALPDREALVAQLERDTRRLRLALGRGLERARLHLRRLEQGLRSHAPAARLAARREAFGGLVEALRSAGRRRLEASRHRFEALEGRLGRAPQASLSRRHTALAGLAGRLDALSPLAVLARGYAIAQLPDGRILRRAREAAEGDELRVRLHEGELDTTVRRIRD